MFYGRRAADAATSAAAGTASAAVPVTSRTSSAPFWALMAFSVVLFISPQTIFPALAPLHLALVTAGGAMLAFVVDRWGRGRSLIEWSPEMAIVAALLVWIILTLPLSVWPSGSLGVLSELYLKTLIVFWLLSQIIDSEQRLRTMAWALTVMAVPIALTALVNFVSGAYIHADAAPSAVRIMGYGGSLTGNPNDLALTLNLFLPLTVALFLSTRAPWLRAVLWLIICLDAIAIVATFSRAGFLTLAVTVGTYLWSLSKRGHRGWVMLVAILIVMATPLLPSGYVERLSTITDIEADPTGSAQTRWSDTRAAIKQIAFNPLLGTGLGTNVLALNELRGETWTEVHNAYLQYGVDLGLPGMILFIWLVSRSINSMGAARRRLTRQSESPALVNMIEGIRISLVAFAVAALFHPVAYHFYFYYIAGLAVAAASIVKARLSPGKVIDANGRSAKRSWATPRSAPSA